MIDVIQSWWHSEDIISPIPGRIIRQVTDFYTDENIIPFNISSFFVELKVRSRFKGNELEFIQKNDSHKKENNLIFINLGNLQDWPSSCDDETLKHVRTEVEYIDIAPVLEEVNFLKVLKTSYSTSFIINEYIQPEFQLTVPLGMKLKLKNNTSTNTTNSNYNNDCNFVEMLMEEEINNESSFTQLSLEKGTFQMYFDKKHKYYFLIDEKSYGAILASMNDSKTNLKSIQVYYNIVFQNRYWLVSLFPILLIVSGLLNVFSNPIENLSNFNLSGIIIFISFLTFFYSLIRDGYELPINKKFILATILISGFVILFPQFIKSILI